MLAEVHLTIASDVSNPLLGEYGAAAIYGPQKGLRRGRMSGAWTGTWRTTRTCWRRPPGTTVRDVPGAGAAGGTTASLLAIADRFASFTIRPGIDVVMELTDFDARLADSDLVLSGEGRIDAQTAFGKTCLGVARGRPRPGSAASASVAASPRTARRRCGAAGAVSLPVIEAPMTVEEAMAAGAAPLERAAERVARLLVAGRRADVKSHEPSATRLRGRLGCDDQADVSAA